MSIQQCINITGNFLKLGVLKFEDAKDAVAAFTTAGSVIIELLNLRKKDDAVMGKLDELNRNINTLHHKIREGFASVKALIVQHDFTKSIINRVSGLERSLGNVFMARSPESITHFLEECRLRRPQTLISDIIDSIRQDVTNPIKYTMDADVLDSREIMRKWHVQIENLAGSLAMIHGVFYGLNGWNNDGTMAANINELKNVLDQFEKEYNVKYWDAVTHLVESTMDNRMDIGNGDKADILRDKLAQIKTCDYFYVVVYNDCGGYDKHSFRHVPSQTLLRFRRGKCNVVVYASESSYGESRIKALEEKVERWRNNSIPSDGDMQDVTKRIYDEMDCGFVGLIRKQHNPQLRWTGHFQWGPGWWITAHGRGWVKYPNSRGAITMPGVDTLLIVGMK